MAIIFSPAIIQTKNELLVALKKGQIKSSKFNALNQDQQLFIELVCFGNYKGAAAMRVIKPKLSDPAAAAFRMAHNQDVVDVMEELTYKRDKMWMAQVAGKREMALNVMEYVMKTTEDEALKVATAKEIIKAADMAIKQNNKSDDDQITGIRLDISFSGDPDKSASHIIDGDFEESDEVTIVDKDKEEPTGMPYKLAYSDDIKDSYEKKD